MNFVKGHSMIIHVQFGFNHIANFWEMMSFSLPCSPIVDFWSTQKHTFGKGLPKYIPAKFAFKWYTGFRLEFCLALVAILDFWSTQKPQTFLRDHSMINHVQFGSNQKSSFWKFSSFHFPKLFNVMVTIVDFGLSNFFIRGSYKEQSYQVTFLSHMWFQRRRFLKFWPIKKHNWS